MFFFHSDTLFFEDFDLQKVIKIYQDFKERDPEANMVLYVTCSDEGEYETQLHLVSLDSLQLDRSNK